MHFSTKAFLTPYLHIFGTIKDKFALFSNMIEKKYTETTPSKGEIWDELVSNISSKASNKDYI